MIAVPKPIASKLNVPEGLLSEFCVFLADNMGLYFPKEKWGDLEKKLIPVMQSFGFEDVSSCIQWLMHHPLDRDHITVLAYHLTIGETYFFRDSRMFSILENRILPEILQIHAKDKKLRIWCAGCCTGEEPYSIAILLHRMLPDLKDWDIYLLGSDINQEFLDKAVQAQYKKWSFRATPPEIKDRYFTKQNDGNYTIVPAIQKMVKFIYLNLVEDSYPNQKNGTCDMDLILCNNVLIYFSQKQIKKTISQLTSSLRKDGWLSVTAIEAPFVNDDRLTTSNFAGAILFKKEEKKELKQEKLQTNSQLIKQSRSSLKQAKNDDLLLQVVLPEFLNLSQPIIEFRFTGETKETMPAPALPSAEKMPSKKSSEKKASIKDGIYEECLKLWQQQQYQMIIAKLLPLIVPHINDLTVLKQSLPEILLLVRTYANQGDLNNALYWCTQALQAEKLDPNLHYLHAVVQQAHGNISEALKSLKHTVYLDPNFVAAHYMLGMLEKQQKNFKGASRHFRIVLDLIKNYTPDDIIPGTEEMTAKHLKELILAMHEG